MSNGTHSTLDPVEVWLRWYDDATAVWSKTLGGDADSYADPLHLYRQWQKGWEVALESFGGLQLATRPDVARVAGLLVGLEDRVESLKARFDDLAATNARRATDELASAGALQSVEKGLVQVEQKLRQGELAAVGTLQGVEKRLAQVEQKLSQMEATSSRLQSTMDRLLVALESAEAKRTAPAGPAEERKTSNKRTPNSEQPAEQA